jgi:predicted dehydrogenase
VGIIGNGGIYRLAHSFAWRRIPRAKVVATCDIIEERAQQARQELGAEDSFTRIENLLKKDSIDIVDICTPSDTHADLTIQALRAGKHVICEKPMALCPQDTSRMMETATESKRQLYIGHTRRFDWRWTHMKEQIDSGRIGEPVAVRRTERCWGGFPSEDWHWDIERSGGVLMDLGIHVTDLFSWFLDAEPNNVFAKALTLRQEAKERHCFDFGVIPTEVIGTRGKLNLSDKDTAPMSVVKEKIEIPRYSTLLSSFPDTFVDELNHFLDCIEGKVQPKISMKQAHSAVQVIDAAFQSISSGRQVTLSGGETRG